MKHLFSLVLVALLFLLVGCEDQKEKHAKELLGLADKLAETNEYGKAIEVMQRIRIDYEGTTSAESAESAIDNLRKLQEMYVDNKASAISNSFNRIATALTTYKNRYLAYPLTTSDVAKLPNAIVPEWTDVWGFQIFYKPTYSSESIPNHLPDGYVLASFGKDGLPGGEGVNQDLFFQDGRAVDKIQR